MSMTKTRGKRLYFKSEEGPGGSEGRIPTPDKTHGVEPTPVSVIDDGVPELHVMPPAKEFTKPRHEPLTEATEGTARHVLAD